MAKTKQVDFWTTKKGKHIRSFGLILIIYSIIMGIAAVGLLAYQVAQTAIYLQAPVFAMEFKVLGYFVLLIGCSVYFLFRGFDIRNNKLSPQQIAILSIVALIFVALKSWLAFSIETDSGEQTGRLIGILDIFIMVEALLYLINWQSAYASHQGGKQLPKDAKKPQPEL